MDNMNNNQYNSNVDNTPPVNSNIVNDTSNMNYNPGSNNYVPQKNKPSIGMIIIITIIVVGIIIGVYFITRPSDNKKDNTNSLYDNSSEQEDYNSSTDSIDDEDELEKELYELANKVSVEFIKLKDGNYLYIVENKADRDIFIEDCDVELYNDSTLVGTVNTYIVDYVAPNSKGYGTFLKAFVKDYKFNKMVPKVKANYYMHKTYGDKISHIEEKQDKYLFVSATNNSNVELDYIVIAALFYDENNNIIGYSDRTRDDNLIPGANVTALLDYPTDEDFKEIPFSRYEVITLAVGKN